MVRRFVVGLATVFLLAAPMVIPAAAADPCIKPVWCG